MTDKTTIALRKIAISDKQIPIIGLGAVGLVAAASTLAFKYITRHHLNKAKKQLEEKRKMLKPLNEFKPGTPEYDERLMENKEIHDANALLMNRINQYEAIPKFLR